MRSPDRGKSKSNSESDSDSNKQLIVIDESAIPLKFYIPKSVELKRFSLTKSPWFDPSSLKVNFRSFDWNARKNSALMAPIESLRKSPRFSSSAEGKGPDVEKKRALLAPIGSLRRSPRFSPSGEVKGGNVGRNLEKKRLLESPTRRFPRLSRGGSGDAEGNLGALAVYSPDRESKKARMDSGNSGLEIMESSLRRSPRIVAVNGGNQSASFKNKKSKGQKLTSSVDKEEINSNVDCFMRSSRPTLTQSTPKMRCLKVATEKILPENLESPLESKPLELTMISSVELEDVKEVFMEIPSEKDTIKDVKEMLMKIPSEKDTSSSRFSSSLVTDEGIGVNAFDNLSDPSDECPSDLQTSDGNGLWQSPKGTLSSFVTETDEVECDLIDSPTPHEKQAPKKSVASRFFFIGDPIPDDEAQNRWGWRYELKNQRSKAQTSKTDDDEEDAVIWNVECHFAQAKIGNSVFSLGDCAYIQGDGDKKHVGKIVEFFKTINGEKYFRVQWFYKVEDTVIKDEGVFHDKRRLFYSTVMNDNLIECIMSKVNIKQIKTRVGSKVNSISPADFYYDMEYCVDYSTFRTFRPDISIKSDHLNDPRGIKTVLTTATETSLEKMSSLETHEAELALLDLYSGCGGMSTGLCLGAKVAGVNLVTRWALDANKDACESLKLNHPETYVRNEAAEDFLDLLKEWEKLCKLYKSDDFERTRSTRSGASSSVKSDDDSSDEEFEVSKLVDICYGDPNGTDKRGLYFKVRWKGFSYNEDTWEPVEGLRNCQDSIREFVRQTMKLKILPLPGEVDVICGGPPCQGISGYNRFRNVDSPLDDERNHQIVVFMDIVNFLKPKYMLMENVVDILRFDKGSLGRYALSRLVHMNYQARLGIMAAGCYGLPQFRLRVFLWGAHPHENLPQFPLPTHDVIVRYWPPPEFERCTVAYDEDHPRDLENLDKALVLQDAISDLPDISNKETREEMSYQNPPETDFQRYIRSTKLEMAGSALNCAIETKFPLYDHRPYPLYEDDYLRVCQIPKRKGANFRDLPGVIVGLDNTVRREPNNKQLLPSGRPLVPDYCFTLGQGKSKRPFGRLWWDETVPTVLTFPSCHNQCILHPEQDRILTVREYARLQGFPDYYRFCGSIKNRYCQIGNAVAVNVGRGLGYSLGSAVQKLSNNEPLMTLPPKFSTSNYFQLVKKINSSECSDQN
ncbi:hypothetical protein UlMin_001039 [Ulmus minor]